MVGAVNPCRSEGESINLPTALTAVARLRSRGRRRGLAMLGCVVLCCVDVDRVLLMHGGRMMRETLTAKVAVP